MSTAELLDLRASDGRTLRELVAGVGRGVGPTCRHCFDRGCDRCMGRPAEARRAA